MYCNNCGKHNPKDSSFCQHCGKKIVSTTEKPSDDIAETQKTPSQQIEHRTEKIDPKEPPYPYAIPIYKLAILSVSTLGLYEVYWFYKQWKSLKAENNLDIGAVGRAIFAPFFSFSLFEHISKLGDKKISARWLGATYFALVVTNRIPEVGWIVSSFSFLALIPAQNALNNYWDKKYKGNLERSGFGIWEVIITVIGIGVILLSIYGLSLPEDTTYDYIDNTTATYQDTVQSETAFLNAYKTSFAESCKEGSDQLIDYCDCTADYLVTNYSQSELIEISDELLNGAYPQEVEDAIDYCL